MNYLPAYSTLIKTSLSLILDEITIEKIVKTKVQFYFLNIFKIQIITFKGMQTLLLLKKNYGNLYNYQAVTDIS